MSDENEVYYKFELQNSSVLSRYTIDGSGIEQKLIWVAKNHHGELITCGLV